MGAQPHSSNQPHAHLEQRVLDAASFLSFSDPLLAAVKDLSLFEPPKIPCLLQFIIIKPLEVELQTFRRRNLRSGEHDGETFRLIWGDFQGVTTRILVGL
jgi:hypothetical protein